MAFLIKKDTNHDRVQPKKKAPRAAVLTGAKSKKNLTKISATTCVETQALFAPHQFAWDRNGHHLSLFLGDDVCVFSRLCVEAEPFGVFVSLAGGGVC
jgi:hypothetical protein